MEEKIKIEFKKAGIIVKKIEQPSPKTFVIYYPNPEDPELMSSISFTYTKTDTFDEALQEAIQYIKGRINKSNPSKNMKKELKHPRKVEFLRELESFICEKVGCHHFDKFYDLVIEEKKSLGATAWEAKKFAETHLVEMWNAPVKEEGWFKPEVFRTHRLSFIYLEAIKFVIAKEGTEKKEEKESLLNPITEEEVMEVKEWLDKIRKKHKIKGTIPDKIVLEELKKEAKGRK